MSNSLEKTTEELALEKEKLRRHNDELLKRHNKIPLNGPNGPTRPFPGAA